MLATRPGCTHHREHPANEGSRPRADRREIPWLEIARDEGGQLPALLSGQQPFDLRPELRQKIDRRVTFYTRRGDVFVIGCAIASGVLILARLFLKLSARRPATTSLEKEET